MINQKRLIRLYKDFFDLKERRWPDWKRAIELALMKLMDVEQSRYQWMARNKENRASLGEEIAQVIMLLIVASDELGIDVEKTTMAWMKKEGFNTIYWSGKDYTNWALPTANATKAHFWGKFDNVFQAACGLEIPEGFEPYKVYIAGWQAAEDMPLCKTCHRYAESRRGEEVENPSFPQKFGSMFRAATGK
ncbi:hypothetical protein LCGC14_2790380 [marine sediment metagenome]|uniref:Uncharacterized protein n=1 Tax=marine sediment metagenome TaxID=412755 RepID=A0A0F8YQM4_9ZZZZ